MRKPAFCTYAKTKTQISFNREADQRLCFRYIDSTIPLLPKYKVSSLYSSCLVVQSGLCLIRSETPKTGFLTTRLNCLLTVELVYARNMSLVVRNRSSGFLTRSDTNQAVDQQKRLEISDLDRRGIVLSM